MKYATSLGCSLVHIMAGRKPSFAEQETCFSTFKDNLSFAVQHLSEHDMVALIEPLNSRLTIALNQQKLIVNSRLHSAQLHLT